MNLNKINKPKILSNPEKIGPGFWVHLHIRARRAQTEESKNSFIDDMYLLSVEFPCGKCRNHIKAYLENHPFDEYFNLVNDKGDQIGMSKWLWQFHNAVNARLGKPLMDWETCWEMYDTNREVCTNCSGSHPGSANNSYDEVAERENFEKERDRVNREIAEKEKERKNTKLRLPGVKDNNSHSPTVDKKKIIAGYFLKKNNNTQGY